MRYAPESPDDTLDSRFVEACQIDESLQSRLKPMHAQWKAKKYIVAVCHSGKEDVYRSTLDLLAYNKKHCAGLAVKRKKAQAQMPL